MNPSSGVFCVRCGELLSPTANFCGSCGHKTKERDTSRAQPERPATDGGRHNEFASTNPVDEVSAVSESKAQTANSESLGRQLDSQVPPIPPSTLKTVSTITTGKRLIACQDCGQPKTDGEACPNCSLRAANEKRLVAEGLAKEDAQRKADQDRVSLGDISGCFWTGCGWTIGAIVVLPFLLSIGPFVAFVGICALVVALIFAFVFKK
jgi:ribosomal protein L32